MQDYEAAAHESLRKMQDKQEEDVLNLKEEIFNSYHVFTLSKKCCDLRSQEKRHFSVKEYLKANALREEADALELVEIQNHQE